MEAGKRKNQNHIPNPEFDCDFGCCCVCEPVLFGIPKTNIRIAQRTPATPIKQTNIAAMYVNTHINVVGKIKVVSGIG